LFGFSLSVGNSKQGEKGKNKMLELLNYAKWKFLIAQDSFKKTINGQEQKNANKESILWLQQNALITSKSDWFNNYSSYFLIDLKHKMNTKRRVKRWSI
jgi:hypothetical protein